MINVPLQLTGNIPSGILRFFRYPRTQRNAKLIFVTGSRAAVRRPPFRSRRAISALNPQRGSIRRNFCAISIRKTYLATLRKTPLSQELCTCRKFIRRGVSTITAPRVSSRRYFSSLIPSSFFHPFPLTAGRVRQPRFSRDNRSRFNRSRLYV